MVKRASKEIREEAEKERKPTRLLLMEIRLPRQAQGNAFNGIVLPIQSYVRMRRGTVSLLGIETAFFAELYTVKKTRLNFFGGQSDFLLFPLDPKQRTTFEKCPSERFL